MLVLVLVLVLDLKRVADLQRVFNEPGRHCAQVSPYQTFEHEHEDEHDLVAAARPPWLWASRITVTLTPAQLS